MEARQNQEIGSKSTPSLKSCFGCGSQFPFYCAICPYCYNRLKRKSRKIIAFSGILSLSGGIIWFIAGFFLIMNNITYHTNILKYPSIEYNIGAVALCLAGTFSFVAGFLMLKAEKCLIAILFSLTAITLGIIVTYNFFGPQLFMIIMINIYVVSTQIVFKDILDQEESLKNMVWSAPSMRGTLSSPPPAQGQG